MGAIKSFRQKVRYAKKIVSNRPLPNWIRYRTDNKIRYNASRRNWRRTKLNFWGVGVTTLLMLTLKMIKHDIPLWTTPVGKMQMLLLLEMTAIIWSQTSFRITLCRKPLSETSAINEQMRRVNPFRCESVWIKCIAIYLVSNSWTKILFLASLFYI